jgi:hypothetical protein
VKTLVPPSTVGPSVLQFPTLNIAVAIVSINVGLDFLLFDLACQARSNVLREQITYTLDSIVTYLKISFSLSHRTLLTDITAYNRHLSELYLISISRPTAPFPVMPSATNGDSSKTAIKIIGTGVGHVGISDNHGEQTM